MSHLTGWALVAGYLAVSILQAIYIIRTERKLRLIASLPAALRDDARKGRQSYAAGLRLAADVIECALYRRTR